MKYAYDLHIHSVLSPCADVLMTPNNIFNMAKLKKLDIISVTDHNSLKQIPVCAKLSKSYDLLFIPGVEITVSEGFDVLCYFKHVDDAMTFDLIIEQYNVRKISNNPYLKAQEIMNINDEVIDIYPYDLSTPLKLSIYKLKDLLMPFEHLLVFAHIDRKLRSGSAYLESIQPNAIELSNFNHKKQDKLYVFNSDAHQITDILERTKDNMISLDKLDINDFFNYFRHD